MVEQNEKILLDVYNDAGQKVSQRELDASVFGILVKPGLLHLAVVAQEANARTVLASTKTRGEVRGGGRKPWRQKGTGRARHGSIRSPLWRGGGITFGPRTDRNFSLKINRKVKQKAICMALSQKAKDGRIILIESAQFEKPKTKEAAAFLQKLPIEQGTRKKSRIAFISPLGAVDTNRSLRNLPFVTVVPAHSLNVVDLLRCHSMVMPLASVEAIEKRYSKTIE